MLSASLGGLVFKEREYSKCSRLKDQYIALDVQYVALIGSI
ncbi:hypothetical protein THF1D04_220023 [Vibrio owensii]|uniref:Uncharacterized protein n=1 Tax=Vibrio owensii TaxID=696485 RepID=A0AAU9Q790_9VIBR|nr:hypothetical protein THF1D04_220023 [Vibrio owensii]